MSLLVDAIKSAVAKPKAFPEPIVVAILQNDLLRTIILAEEIGSDLAEILEAIRYYKTHVPTSEVTAIIKRFGK